MSEVATAVLIPAYQPAPELVDLVHRILAEGIGPVIVVNDGSRAECHATFAALEKLGGVTVLRHAVNLGKGAALKTGMHFALNTFPQLHGVITVDADGQHAPKDAAAVRSRFLAAPLSLVLGVREFKNTSLVPWRSRFGNTLTRKLFQLLTGAALSDTQTGLRAIPTGLIKNLLRIPATGYEFETDMLLLALREQVALIQHPIETVYIDGNSSSHFNPLVDSFKIYFVLLRFTLNSVLTGFIDFAVFALTQSMGMSILSSSISGRITAGAFNFLTSKRFVFRSGKFQSSELVKYVLLVALLLTVSNSTISACVRRLGMNVYLAKLLVEGSLFLISFSVQRTFVFTRGARQSAQIAANARETDWDAYYSQPFKTASVTRKITIARILNFLAPIGPELNGQPCVEFGGGNSCVYESLRAAHPFQTYRVVDTNEIGLKLFNERALKTPADRALLGSVLNSDSLDPSIKNSRLCLSIGLIEHFDAPQTARAIQTHFESVKPGGWVLMTYPTPTWLYRMTRGAAELLGIWKFHDERPLQATEVLNEVQKHGTVVRHEIIWPIFLTQGIVLSQKYAPK